MASARKSKGTAGSRERSKGKATPSRSSSSAKERKLDEVSDAPESGEPRAQGRSRGRIIDRDGTAAGRKSGSGARNAGIGKRRGSAADPTAAARIDESGDTANEAWESGRQKAMGGPEE